MSSAPEARSEIPARPTLEAQKAWLAARSRFFFSSARQESDIATLIAAMEGVLARV